jgi:hypothetical protein
VRTNTAKTVHTTEETNVTEPFIYWDINGKPPVDPRKAALNDIDLVMRKHAAALKKAFQKV